MYAMENHPGRWAMCITLQTVEQVARITAPASQRATLDVEFIGRTRHYQNVRVKDRTNEGES